MKWSWNKRIYFNNFIRTKLKNLILVFIFISSCFTITYAQDDNPYSKFGYKGKVLKTKEEELGKQFLFINNTDTTQKLKCIVLNTKNHHIEYIDHNNNVYKTDSLLPIFVLRFLNPDPHANKYPDINPYNFVHNTPMRAIDPDGRDIYILFYTTGSDNASNEMFRASALTRQVDIERSKGFDPTKDKVVVLGLQDMASIKNQVNNVVKQFSPKYGQTQEFSIWSHAGTNGPVGSVTTSQDNLSNETGFPGDNKQMTIAGWGKIDFNWKNNGTGTNANFFGCKTGKNGTGIIDLGAGFGVEKYETPSFAKQISSLPNFSNVTVGGQTTSSFPSMYTNYRQNSENGPGNFINGENDEMVYFQRTYLVGGEHSFRGLNSKASQSVANLMQYNVNGNTVGTGYQSGTKKP